MEKVIAMSWDSIGNIKGPPGISGQITDQGLMPLTMAQDYIDVLLNKINDDNNWLFVEKSVLNTLDDSPLNIFGGILLDKTDRSFRLQLSGMPDSPNYFLRWAVNGMTIPPTPAVTYQLFGPNAGQILEASMPFTVKLLPSTTLAAPVIITPSDGLVSGAGTFTPATVTLTTAAPSATFTYTPQTAGAHTLHTSNNGGLTDPAPVPYTANISVRLLNGLISYWTLDEGSGNRMDSHGTNHLVPTAGNPGSFAFVLGNGAYSNGAAGAAYLACASNPSLQVTGDFTFSFWVRVDGPATANTVIIGKNNPGFSSLDFLASHSATNGLTFQAGGATVAKGAPEAAFQQRHVIVWFDSVDNKLRMRIDDATTYVSAGTATLTQGADPFAVLSGSYGNVNWNGLADEIAFYKRKLNSAEMTALYGGGTPPRYSSFTAGRLREALNRKEQR